MAESILLNKAEDFGVEIIILQRKLVREFKEYEVSNQVKRSGTAIGALVCEATYAESSADFVHKLKIALKESHETEYWLRLLFRSAYIQEEEYHHLSDQNVELKRMLIASINTKLANTEP